MLGNLERTGSLAVAVAAGGAGAMRRGMLYTMSSRFRFISPLMVVAAANAVT